MSALNEAVRRRVLVVDDNREIHDDYRRVLRPAETPAAFQDAKALLFGAAAAATPAAGAAAPSFELETSLRGEEAVEKASAARIADQPYLVAFVDMRMAPGWDGVQTIEKLWQVDPRVQVVICTAYSDAGIEEITQRLGASDRLLFLRKPFDSSEILQLARTLSEKWIAEQAARARVDELEQAVLSRTREIEHAMLHDRLTGLPNRALIHARIEACIQRRKRKPDFNFGLLFIDFDRFKYINDSLGHEVGDQLLVEISGRLTAGLRPVDAVSRSSTPSRIGGDEFLVLLEDLAEEADAAAVAQRLLTSISEPYILNDQQLQVTASIGIATSRQAYACAADVIRDADTAMYRAKQAGRARYAMFDDVMHAQVSRRMALEQALRRAIRDSALDVHYQPIIDLPLGSVAGYEALLRWSTPDGAVVPTPEVIEIAEETGLIQPLTLIVLRMACEQLKRWQSAAHGAVPPTIAVNLSRRQLIDQELRHKVAEVVRESGIRPGTLILEITESAALPDEPGAISVLAELREMGVWLHLDDFGVGYSSLSCLYRLPISAIKIDREFIARVFERAEHRTVLDAIVRIAHAFGYKIVAEGVETTEQLELVRTLGIDYAQGYLFGRPATAADLAILSPQAGPVDAFERLFHGGPPAQPGPPAEQPLSADC